MQSKCNQLSSGARETHTFRSSISFYSAFEAVCCRAGGLVPSARVLVRTKRRSEVAVNMQSNFTLLSSRARETLTFRSSISFYHAFEAVCCWAGGLVPSARVLAQTRRRSEVAVHMQAKFTLLSSGARETFTFLSSISCPSNM